MFDPTGLVPGDYTVTYTYTNLKGCTSSDNKTVTIDPKPAVTALSNSPVCLGATIQLVGISDNATSYHWTGPNGFTSNEQSPSIPNATLAMAGDYTLTATSALGCRNTATVSVSVIPCVGPELGATADISAQALACPLSLSVNMGGRVASVNMSADGSVCGSCIARDPSGKHSLEIEDRATLLLADGTPPKLITFRAARTPAPLPQNTVLLGQAYELNAYATTYEHTPLPLTISPPARLLLSYDPEELPRNATEVFVATYSPQEGWVPLTPVSGAVAAVGEVRCLVSHFSVFAALARVPEPSPAKFTVSNLNIVPKQVQPNQQLTISIEIANAGEQSGDYSLELVVDGKIKATRSLALAGGEKRTTKFTISEAMPGTHSVELAGLTAEFTVIKQSRLPSLYWWLIAAVAIAIVLVLVKLLLGR